MSDNCQTCELYKDCAMPPLVQLSLIAEFGEDWQGMLDKVTGFPVPDSGLQNFVTEWINQHLKETEEEEE